VGRSTGIEAPRRAADRRPDRSSLKDEVEREKGFELSTLCVGSEATMPSPAPHHGRIVIGRPGPSHQPPAQQADSRCGPRSDEQQQPDLEPPDGPRVRVRPLGARLTARPVLGGLHHVYEWVA